MKRLALIIAFLTSIVRAEPAPQSPREVWAGFDPRAEPLEIEVVKEWDEAGAHFREFYFTGMTHEGSKVRVYAIYSAPFDSAHGKPFDAAHGKPVGGTTKLPAVMHIHGGGQTAYVGWLKYWNARGYAALTFNWGGRWEGRDKFTDWGKLTQGNHMDCAPMVNRVDPVQLSSWYLWTRVCRRALTALEQQPEVDREKLGIFGVSMGGTIAWPFAAMDDRVKAAVAIYGAGWTTYPDAVGADDPQASDPKMVLWRQLMEPESYAPLIRAPILLLNATNDQHGNMDRSYFTLDSTPGFHRQAYTPRYRHHIAAAEGHNLPLWMDTFLKHEKIEWPASPVVRVELGSGGVPRMTLVAEQPGSVARVELFYAVENRNPKNRFWRSAPHREEGKQWTASVPVLDTRQPLFAFANVHYTSGVCLSSNLATVIPAELGPASATDQASMLIDDFSQDLGGWVTSSPGTDPVEPVPSLIRRVTGPDSIPGLTVTAAIPLSTHKIGDPKWRGQAGAKLQFQVHAQSPRTVQVIVHEKEFEIGWMKYIAELTLSPADGWQTITLSAGDFKTDKGVPLPAWSVARMLELVSKGGPAPEPIYTGFRWMHENAGN